MYNMLHAEITALIVSHCIRTCAQRLASRLCFSFFFSRNLQVQLVRNIPDIPYTPFKIECLRFDRFSKSLRKTTTKVSKLKIFRDSLLRFSPRFWKSTKKSQTLYGGVTGSVLWFLQSSKTPKWPKVTPFYRGRKHGVVDSQTSSLGLIWRGSVTRMYR